MSEPLRNVQVRSHTHRTFVINPFIHICQKEKIVSEIVAKILAVNGLNDDVIPVLGSFFLLLPSEVPRHLFHFPHDAWQAKNQI